MHFAIAIFVLPMCASDAHILACRCSHYTSSNKEKGNSLCYFPFRSLRFFAHSEEHCTNRFVVHEYCIVRCTTGCNANENEHRIYFMFIRYFNFDYLKKHLDAGVSRFWCIEYRVYRTLFSSVSLPLCSTVSFCHNIYMQYQHHKNLGNSIYILNVNGFNRI